MKKETKTVNVGGVLVGGNNEISVQSMLNVIATDIKGNVEQAKQLKAAGCEILRVAIPNKNAVRLINAIKSEVDIPLVADIHFDYRLALESVAAGIDKIRINPGNIGDDDKVKLVADACRAKNIPIRIGVNSGSLEKNILAKYGHVTADALVDSGLYHISLLEKFDFNDIVLSLKSSSVQMMYDAYVKASEVCNYPLHLGVTEAGTYNAGLIKSAAGIGGLLLRGIGSTIRVSLTDDPVKEVYCAKDLLKSLGLKKGGANFVSCPTCGRTQIDLISLANEIETKFKNLNKDITIAVMGCIVNGPGEAREADIGIAGGNGYGILFKKGEIIKNNIPEAELVSELEKEIKSL